MSGVITAAAPLALFGDLDGDLWGIIVGGEQPRAAVGRLGDADLELRPAELDAAEDDIWTLLGGGCDLRIERADATTSAGAEDEGLRLEPCRVSGSVEVGGNRREIDIGGVRSDGLGAAGRDSLRLFGAWFPAGHEIAMIAARPAGAKGHDHDTIGVIARGEEHPLVLDPRLSTTYDGAGVPRRIGLELWLGDDPEGDLWPRRVAGASTGSRVSGMGLSAHAFDCVSRGEPGAGVYALLRR
jgi:hypothetical protein